MNKKNKMHVVAIDMGYGHQRAAYPFLKDSKEGIITINNYQGIPDKERKSWESGQKTYEKISYFKKTPLLGDLVFSIMDSFQKIDHFYPRRDLSKKSSQQLYFYRKTKKGLGKDLIEKLNKNPLPMLTTFFVPAYFAEYHGYAGDIYCIVCDADISRAWAPVEPKTSRVIYLAPNKRVKERLQLYGVRKENIIITGFPLPKENVGEKQEIVKKDLAVRLKKLDPQGVYHKKYKGLLKEHLGKDLEKNDRRLLTVTFAVGGAGAQRDLGATILKSLKNSLKQNKIALNLIAGSREDVNEFFKEVVKTNGLKNNKNVQIIYNPNKVEYFKLFNKCLRKTDILWTKPSELTFYSGLGLPIIMSDPVGSQEDFNRQWLIAIGAGLDSDDPEYTNEWLFDWINSGWLAEAAMEGFLDAPKMGTYHIEDLILRGKNIIEDSDIQLL